MLPVNKEEVTQEFKLKFFEVETIESSTQELEFELNTRKDFLHP